MNRRMLAAHAVVMLVITTQAVYKVRASNGLFNWLGIDYAMYSTGTKLILTDRPWDVFDLDVFGSHMASFAQYYRRPAPTAGPAPHHALTFLTFAPFAWFPPVPGYSLWVLANAALAVLVLRRLDARFPERSWGRTFLVLTFFPLVYALFVGQPIVLMLLGMAQAYSAWERRRDFEAGLWLGLLLLKPQYPAVLVLVLLAKRQWRTLAGFATTGMVFLVTTLAVYGIRGTLAWLETMQSLSQFRDVHQLICPRQMISLRALVVNLLPVTATDGQGKLATYSLTALALGAVPLIWRGAWNPSDPRFATRMLGTMLVTMLVVFHNHIHGATLLVVPAMVVMAQGRAPRVLRALIVVGLYAPTIVFGVSYRAEAVASLVIGVTAITLGVIVAEELALQRADRECGGRPGRGPRRPLHASSPVAAS